MMVDGSAFRHRRTREELDALLRHGHVIPISTGRTSAYVREQFPGWTWNALVEVIRAADILVDRGSSPPRCDERVAIFHFDSADSWLVEWADGTRTERRASAAPWSGALLDRLWGCGDPDRLFGTSQRTTPWIRGGKDRRGPTYDRVAVADLLAQPVGLVDVDPRTVRCTQPWLVRHHVEYYLTGRWELSGRTSADQHLEANRFPVIVPDRHGRLVILSGHHRTAAALLEGRHVRARIAAPGAGFHVTPRIVADPTLTQRMDPAETVVADLNGAASLLARLGVSADDTNWAIATASRRLTQRGDDGDG